ncbi:MAG: Rid family detoxifying hydrolase [Bacilli bacterium]
MKKRIDTINAPKAVGPYSQAIDTGDTLYVSGQLPLNPKTMKFEDTIEKQTVQSLTNVMHIVEEAGYKMKNAVKVTVLLSDISDFEKMNAEYTKFFDNPFPARICYEVSKLPMGAKIEIDLVVIKND